MTINDHSVIIGFLEIVVLMFKGIVFVPKLIAMAARRIRLSAAVTWMTRLAARAGFRARRKKLTGMALTPGTNSQREALEKLHRIARAFYQSKPDQLGHLRLAPLVVGPSGTGKTHLVRTLARQLKLPVLHLASSTWVPHELQRESTLFTLLRYLDRHEQFVLHLDELEQLVCCRLAKTHRRRAIVTELQSVLDRCASNTGTNELPWTERHSQCLQNGALIVGSYTHHQTKRVAKFGPRSLLTRFYHDWVRLEPCTAQDFTLLGCELKIPPLALDPVQAAKSGRNFRYLEDLAASAAVSRCEHSQSLQSPS